MSLAHQNDASPACFIFNNKQFVYSGGIDIGIGIGPLTCLRFKGFVYFCHIPEKHTISRYAVTIGKENKP